MKRKILITGSNGQLGNCLKKVAVKYQFDYDFYFADSNELDITNEDSIQSNFKTFQPDFCINAAAYTAVDQAEKEIEKAFEVNHIGVENLATVCKNYNTILIHISTDYVFDGDTNISYSEDNFTNPIGVYGKSKKLGEEAALENNPKTIIIRTSWLYSQFNKNFLKTMLHLFSQKEEIKVVADQFGQPTNANDLAECIMEIIKFPRKTYGLYHFSNYPETTWYDFAKKIAEFSNSKIIIHPITTAEYPTPAKRPKRSTMSLDKIEKDYHIVPKHWENSLFECLQEIDTLNE